MLKVLKIWGGGAAALADDRNLDGLDAARPLSDRRPVRAAVRRGKERASRCAEVDPSRVEDIGGHPFAQHVVLTVWQPVDGWDPGLTAIVGAPDAQGVVGADRLAVLRDDPDVAPAHPRSGRGGDRESERRGEPTADVAPGAAAAAVCQARNA
jgi:hypothetical protein